jgi:gliding motility-associated lipoprotein GldB
MKYFSSLFILIFIFACFTNCKSDSNSSEEITKISIDIEFLRFDTLFWTAQIEDIPLLKRQYPDFFPEQYPDSIWVQKMKDTLLQKLYLEVIETYPNEEKLDKDLKNLFQHIKYYFPQFNTPKVVITTSALEYKNKIILSDKLLILSLDNYLGSDHPYYEHIPNYISQNMKETQISSDIASVYAQKWIPRSRDRTFLEQMVYHGKILYLKDLWLPNNLDSEKIGYTKDEFTWIKENETEIWRNFVENEYMYSTNPKLVTRFISPAPFSKFYLEIDNDSPGMVGRFIGWQIVRSYIKNNKSNIEKLLSLSAEELFNKSKYKPKK